MNTEWLIVSFAVLIAAMSPGPDFIVTVRNTLAGSRRAGIMTALGLGAGVCVHVSYCLAGIAVVISQSVMLFSVFKILGAAYLFYIGVKALRSKGMNPGTENGRKESLNLTSFQAFRSGFLTNLLNPKATLFFLALFTQMIGPETGFVLKLLYGLSSAIIVSGWFLLVSLVLSAPILRRRYLAASLWIDRVFGGFLILMGARLALSKNP